MCCDCNILTEIIAHFDRQEALSQHFDASKLWELVAGDDDEIKSWLARALVFDQENMQTLGLLSLLSLDPDAAVRVEAVDSLGNFSWPQSYFLLKRALYDGDELVRAYAAYGVAVVGNKLFPGEAKETLQSLLLTETSVRVKIDIFEGLYILGDNSALTHLIQCYNMGDYHVKCAVLNALENQLSNKSINQIIYFLNNCRIEKEPIAVKSTFSRLLAECRKMNITSYLRSDEDPLGTAW